MPDLQMHSGWERELRLHVHGKIHEVADDILVDARKNLLEMHAYETGNLYRSGTVREEGNGFEVGFTADYAAYVHEGVNGHNRGQRRPYLANAAFKDRGIIK